MPVASSDGKVYEDFTQYLIGNHEGQYDPDTDVWQAKDEQNLSQPQVAEPNNATQGGDHKVFFVRHGETPENETNTIREKDTQLTDKGRQQAETAARQLKSEGVDSLVSSTLPRAKETAHIIAGKLGIVPQFDPRLNTWDMGNLEGQPCSDENNQKIKDAVEKTPSEPLGNAESFNDFKDRSFAGIRDSILNNQGKKLAILTHSKTEGALKSWEATGQDNPSIDPKVVNAPPDKPGSVEPFTMKADSTIMQGPEWDPFDKAATRVREAVKPGVTGHLSYTERTGQNISNYIGSREEGMLTRGGEAIATSPIRTLVDPMFRGAQHFLEAIKTISDSGHEGPLTDEQIQEVAPKLFDATMSLPGPGPSSASKNTASMFTGQYGLARTLIAEVLEHYGMDAKKLKKLTGMERGADLNWRREISDIGSYVNIPKDAFEASSDRFKQILGLGKINPNKLLGPVKDPNIGMHGGTRSPELKDIFEHPELYKAYPELANTPIEKSSGASYGSFTPDYKIEESFGLFKFKGGTIKLNIPKIEQRARDKKTTTSEELKSVLLHEIQHWIQHKEGFSRGQLGFDTKAELGKIYEDHWKNNPEAFTEHMKQYNKTFGDTRPTDLDAFQKAGYNMIEEGQYMAYLTQANEAEARNVQARMKMDPYDIKRSLGKETTDIPYKQQVLPAEPLGVTGKKGELKLGEEYSQDAPKIVPRGGGPAGGKGVIRSSESDMEDIRRMLDEGQTMSQIGEYLGISRNAVAGIMNREGLKSKNQPGLATARMLGRINRVRQGKTP